LVYSYLPLALVFFNSAFHLPKSAFNQIRIQFMITKITGTPVTISGEVLTLAVGAFEYEVLIPEFTRRHLQEQIGKEISLHTIEYLEGNPMQGRMTPRLIGFLTGIEREFFELFCQVDGVGVKKALRAMIRPVEEVAQLIEDQDPKGLTLLPGVGPATAERIIAKLRRKVPKFALLVGRDAPTAADVPRDIISEAFEVLRALGHSEHESRRLLDEAIARKKNTKTSKHCSKPSTNTEIPRPTPPKNPQASRLVHEPAPTRLPTTSCSATSNAGSSSPPHQPLAAIGTRPTSSSKRHISPAPMARPSMAGMSRIPSREL